MNINVDIDEYIETDINMYDIDDLIIDIGNISLFVDRKELLNFSKLKIDDYDSEQIQEILDATFIRYKKYLQYVDKQLKNYIIRFMNQFKNYKEIDDSYLFEYMNYIDNKIIEKIK